ncbi:hypothetical protein CONPUDRAFT_146397 [Coniophora puteana RWD-64-598 SS2]|uniref:Uncharacterized protein n=1 Tax=Coniophora puteana (strain RWD-64-598) TaxID=741705 RepID=A0A5M3MEJ2_CONPW|nr:uncharacterized protein CONPUDRAFT_146397 [Coniophora puteana RWD-64-598 SS2]EIW77467.1 hypothetical protein CONPUDRAFT_146397 [Coniophora puteana RWD-64-598 SS2]
MSASISPPMSTTSSLVTTQQGLNRRLVEVPSLLRSPHKHLPPLPTLISGVSHRWLAYVILVCTASMGLACLALSIYLAIVIPGPDHPFAPGWDAESVASPEILKLGISGIVTLCVESLGYIHEITLRSALLSEDRLQFNTNGRLFTATKRRRWTGPNSVLSNIFMTICLMLSFTSASAIIATESAGNSSGNTWQFVSAWEIPLFTLGICILAQTSVVLCGLRTIPVATWSTTALSVTSDLIRLRYIRRNAGRCMCDISDASISVTPRAPLLIQPSAWQARRDIRRIILTMWLFTLLYAAWGAWWLVTSTHSQDEEYFKWNWTFFVGDNTPGTLWTSFKNEHSISTPKVWAIYYGFNLLQQGFLAIALHLAGIVACTLQDERSWRQATNPGGARSNISPVKSVFSSPLNAFVTLTKPLLHWMSSLSSFADTGINFIDMTWYPVQMLNLVFVLAVLMTILTILAVRRPRGPQPSAYVHIQTLANLIDEWPAEEDRLYWGDKGYYELEDGDDVCAHSWEIGERWRHAGTSSKLLGSVHPNALYALQSGDRIYIFTQEPIDGRPLRLPALNTTNVSCSSQRKPPSFPRHFDLGYCFCNELTTRKTVNVRAQATPTCRIQPTVERRPRATVYENQRGFSKSHPVLQKYTGSPGPALIILPQATVVQAPMKLSNSPLCYLAPIVTWRVNSYLYVAGREDLASSKGSVGSWRAQISTNV